MKIKIWKFAVCNSLFLFSGCAGIKVVNPNQKNDTSGTLALDITNGKIELAETYTCRIFASNGNRVSAIGKTQDEAQKEALAKCRDQTLVSFCETKNVKCEKN